MTTDPATLPPHASILQPTGGRTMIPAPRLRIGQTVYLRCRLVGYLAEGVDLIAMCEAIDKAGEPAGLQEKGVVHYVGEPALIDGETVKAEMAAVKS